MRSTRNSLEIQRFTQVVEKNEKKNYYVVRIHITETVGKQQYYNNRIFTGLRERIMLSIFLPTGENYFQYNLKNTIEEY